jgi:hypothetical protein
MQTFTVCANAKSKQTLLRNYPAPTVASHPNESPHVFRAGESGCNMLEVAMATIAISPLLPATNVNINREKGKHKRIISAHHPPLQLLLPS